MYNSIRKLLARDEGVSPVIGTILMVAVTVVLGATVYSAVNGFGSNSVQESTNAVFKASAVDADRDGRTDTLKITYLTGPADVADSDIIVMANGPTGAVTLTWTRSDSTAPIAWNPGDFTTVTGAGTYFISATVLGTTVLDQAVTLDE